MPGHLHGGHRPTAQAAVAPGRHRARAFQVRVRTRHGRRGRGQAGRVRFVHQFPDEALQGRGCNAPVHRAAEQHRAASGANR